MDTVPESDRSEDSTGGRVSSAPGAPSHHSSEPKFRFSWIEFSGSLGDLGLFLPLVVAMTIACDLDMGVILITAGLMNVLTGWIFRQPIPVQPMKAIAAVAITEGLLAEEIMAAGLLTGALVLAFSFVIGPVGAVLPKAIVRGIQLGVGLKLAALGATDVAALPLVAWDSMLTAALVGAALLYMLTLRRQPVLLYIFLLGFAVLYLDRPEAYQGISFTAPGFRLAWPSAQAWTGGFLKGALPQLPLTLLNSVIAVCALSADYFPGRGIAPRRMAASVGLMNLLCVPFGAIPMCHGSGGLAAQYRFGARSGGSVIMLGALKIVVGLAFGGALLSLLGEYPMAILGPMLIFAGIELARVARDCIARADDLVIVLVTAAFILGVNTWAGFLAGSAMAAVLALRPRLFGTGDQEK